MAKSLEALRFGAIAQLRVVADELRYTTAGAIANGADAESVGLTLDTDCLGTLMVNLAAASKRVEAYRTALMGEPCTCCGRADCEYLAISRDKMAEALRRAGR